MEIKVGNKKSGSYIDYMKHNPSEVIHILARGSNTSKAVYIAAVMKEKGYNITNFEIESTNIGKTEPLAVLNITMKANYENQSNKTTSN
jgi:DNA-binding protein